MSNPPGQEPLPTWPPRTIGILSTVDQDPHAIPVSAPVRAADRRILFSLRWDRESVARIVRNPRIALTILAEGNVAFTARGPARVLDDTPTAQPDYRVVDMSVQHIDDHRQSAFTVDAGIGRSWHDQAERTALGARVDSLERLARTSRAIRAAHLGPPQGEEARP